MCIHITIPFVDSLVADTVVFNSFFNLHSFLDGIDGHLRLMPDFKPTGVIEQIKPKCQVLYFPVDVPTLLSHSCCNPDTDVVSGLMERLVRTTLTEIDDHSTHISTEPSSFGCTTKPLHIVWPHRW